MKKIIVSLAVVLLLAAYVFYQHQNKSNATSSLSQTPALTTTPDNTPTGGGQTSAPSETINPSASGSTTTSSDAGQPAQSTGGTGATNGQYKDGTYTSPVTDAIYGNLQLKTVISGGKLSDIQFVQYPDQKGHTMEVSQQSLPVLKSEAITAQSASIDIVSGATQTSDAFKQALSATLAMAK